MNKPRLFPLLLVLVIILSACQMGGGNVVATEPGMVTEMPVSTTNPPVTEPPTAEPPVTDPPAGSSGIPADPQEIAFQASDGQALMGLYYPAAVNPAPLVVFIHWVNGDKSDWYELAVWLQNRGQANPFPNPGTEPWWDPAWFPVVPADRSYGVFIFSLRGCQPANAGCATWTPEVWLLDAQAAMLTATTLEGVDPTRIVSIGSSIGADGAPDACAWLNQQQPGACQGALSLSPGNYMNIPYPQVVSDLGKIQPPVAAWCLADSQEIAFCDMATAAGNPAYQAFEIPDGFHGTMLLRPNLEPLPMQLILDFLLETIGPPG